MAEHQIIIDDKKLYLMDMVDFRITTQEELAAFILEYDGINVPCGDSGDKIPDLTNWMDSFATGIPGTIVNGSKIITNIRHYYIPLNEHKPYLIHSMGFYNGIVYNGIIQPFPNSNLIYHSELEFV